MSRKHESSHSGSANRSLASLKSLRSQIDKLDLNILKLVNERARLATEIGKLKSDSGGEVFALAHTPYRVDGVRMYWNGAKLNRSAVVKGTRSASVGWLLGPS